ncbi:MAG: 16S rRNA (guanine(527)-N(7))-methyltransferase RsmG [Oscillospiraceae bacterium]|nr:16S rRNA (guanine(527)-N(7))-methyltransferase RsmG [Oscillospiraceae bacterium]
MSNYNYFKEKFIYYFDYYNLDYNDEIIYKFYDFTNILTEENKKYNLISRLALDNIGELILKHYIDSAIILKYFEIADGAKIIDVGCGAGFPSLPVAFMRPDLNISFLDSSAKKINFIRNAAGQNRGLNFYCGRAEELARTDLRESYDCAVSRAVAKLNILCELSTPFVKPGGYFIAYKSVNAEEEIRESKNAAKTFGLVIEDIKEFDLDNNRRVLIKIKKIKETPSKYPRNFANITKNPV